MSRPRKKEKKTAATAVAPSPLNPVKLELALALVLGAALVVAVPRLVVDEGRQWLFLAAYGSLAAVWIVWRTRRILRRSARGGEFYSAHGEK